MKPGVLRTRQITFLKAKDGLDDWHEAYRVPLVVELGGFGEVHLVLSQDVQRPLHQQTLLLVVSDQSVPQRVLGVEQGVGQGEEHQDGQINTCYVETASHRSLLTWWPRSRQV